MFVVSVFFVTTNGQCSEDDNFMKVSKCDGLVWFGTYIFVDMKEIGRPCTCTVSSLFVGNLLVTSLKVTADVCYTRVTVNDTVIFNCNKGLSTTVPVIVNDIVVVKAENTLMDITGSFHQCVGLTKNDGNNGNFSVKCGSQQETTTESAITTKTVSSSLLASSVTFLNPTSTESLPVMSTNMNTDVTMSSNTSSKYLNSLSMDSTQDDQENMIYIIVGSAAAGTIILAVLVVLILVMTRRTRSGGNKNVSSDADMAHSNKVFDRNSELPDNPLYLSSQPMDELGYSSDQEKQLGLPPTDSKTKKKINSNYDVPPNNKPIDHGESSIPVYAVPKMGKDRTPEVSTGDVYAEVNRGTVQDPVRKRNEDGLLYMEVEQDTTTTNQTNTNDKNEITVGVCYAEIKRT